MKIEPLEEWVGDDAAVSYVAIRADESGRKGYVSTKPNIRTVLPFVEDNIDHDGVLRILNDAGIGLPKYYEWRTRSGCYFCFFQRKAEWVGLADRHPELLQRAIAIEAKVRQDAGADGDASFGEYAMKGRQYTWSGGESLPELIARREEILARHEEAKEQAKNRKKNRPVWEVLGDALDDDDDSMQCSVCAL